MKLEEIKVGMSESYTQTITDADIKSYAGISGDRNPVHLSEEYAENSRYHRRIVHGFISAGFFSALFGMRLPGPGCVYVNQSLNFKRPVYMNDTVIATIVVTQIDIKRRRVFFDTICKVKKKIVIDGKAELYLPHEKEAK